MGELKYTLFQIVKHQTNRNYHDILTQYKLNSNIVVSRLQILVEFFAEK